MANTNFGTIRTVADLRKAIADLRPDVEVGLELRDADGRALHSLMDATAVFVGEFGILMLSAESDDETGPTDAIGGR